MHKDDEGRTFNKDGTMTVRKNGDTKIVRLKRLKETESSSNGLTRHITTQWEDGYCSCTCNGFIFLKDKTAARGCKHTKASKASNFTDMQTPDKYSLSRGGRLVTVKTQIKETDDRRVEI